MLPASAISRVCGVNVEYRNFNAGAGGFLPQRLAVIGVGNDDAEYSLDKYESIGSADAVAKKYGYGSPLHLAARQLFPSGGGGAAFPVTFYPLAQSAQGAAAAGAIGCEGTATAAGEATAYIGGVQAIFAVLKDQAASEILAAAKTAIASVLEMPVVAGDVNLETSEIPITAKWKGAVGNTITIEVQCDVPGITFETTAMSGGAVDSDVGPALNKIGGIWETFILSCFAYNNATRLDQYQVFADGRWNQLEKMPCLVAHGCADDYATRTAITDLRKTDNRNFLIQNTGSRELPFVIAAKGLLNDIVTTANENPPCGYKGLLTGLHTGADELQENWLTRNNAVTKGASTSKKNGSVAELCDVITFYHPEGEAIPGYRYVADCVKLMNVVFNVRMIMESDDLKGAPLVTDATPTTNPKAVQPKTIRTAFINLANSLAAYAIIQEPEFTKANMMVQISSQNPKRLDTRFPCKLSGNVEVTSNDIYFGFYLGAA
jgi:phage tail sheath gpL-like